MKIKIFPKKNDIREGVPIELLITNANGKPKVLVDNLGKIDVKKINHTYTATFWSMKEGMYRVKINDNNETIIKEIQVQKQEFMSFKKEFTFFGSGVLVILTCLGVWIWKNHQKNTI